MPFKNHKSALHQSGFSLIELMVGMVIGLLAVLVIMQVFSVFEGQKRTTTGTADAQTNAAISLYSIQREALLAGFGLSLYGASNPLLCTTGPNLSAVTIVDGGAGAGASDSITFRYGNSPNGGIPVKINGVAGNIVGVDNNMGCQVGNDVLIADGANCIMTTVTGPTDIAIPPVPTSPPDTNHVQLASGAGVLNGSDLSCLGTWSTITFAINNNQLERNGTPIVSDIVNIQAQYGISNASNDNVIAQWVNATGAWAAPAANERNHIKAIRISIIARNGLLEKNIVTTACSSTNSANPTGLCAWAGTAGSPAPTVNLTNLPNFGSYRYRVFDTIIPIRNVVWGKNYFPGT